MATRKTFSPEALAATVRDTFVKADQTIESAEQKASELRAVAINQAIDALKAHKWAQVDIRTFFDDLLESLTWKESTEQPTKPAGMLKSSTARAYKNGIRNALEFDVAFTTSLHAKPALVKALRDAGHSVPKALADEAAKQEAAEEAKHAKRGTKAGKVKTITKDGIVNKAMETLIALRRDALACGWGDEAGLMLDALLAIKPDFVWPKDEDAAPL